MSDRSSPDQYVFRNQRHDGRRPASDASYLDALAKRLAHDARLP